MSSQPLNDHNVEAIRWRDGRLTLLDQRRLPAEEVWLDIPDLDSAIHAISGLAVRGAPAIGITAAYAAVIAGAARGEGIVAWMQDMARLAEARPTAVNLRWAVKRMMAVREAGGGQKALEQEARRIHAEDVSANQAMAGAGAALIQPGSGVLTHCNTGSLATGGVGTALGVIVRAWREQRLSAVYAGETRPWLQGARLTAWECSREGVPASVIVDGAGASLMREGKIQWVITGADRITANGDVANKIGTYSLAVLARAHNAGFMVVAPGSTLDPDTPTGDDVPIESREAGEIWRAAGLTEGPQGVSAWNPVFDITPGELVTAIVTERGVLHPPYTEAAIREASKAH